MTCLPSTCLDRGVPLEKGTAQRIQKCPPKMTQVFPGRGKQKLKLEPQWGGRTLGEAWVESEGKRLQVSSADLVVESEGK